MYNSFLAQGFDHIPNRPYTSLGGSGGIDGIANRPFNSLDGSRGFGHNANRHFTSLGGSGVVDDRCVHIYKLPYDVTDDLIGAQFSRFGVIKIGGIQIVQKEIPGYMNFSVAFITFEEASSANAAIQASGCIHLGGRKVFVEFKTSKKHTEDARIFTPELQVFSEGVIAIPLQMLYDPRIHGCWPGNVVNGEVIHLQSPVYIEDRNVFRRALAFVRREYTLKRTVPGSILGGRYWQPAYGSGEELWIHEVKVHNMYMEKIFREDFFDVTAAVCIPYIHRIPEFIDEYKKNLYKGMRTGFKADNITPFSPELDALSLFGETAEEVYGKDIRVNVVKGWRVDLGFLHDPQYNLVHNPRNTPQHNGELRRFYKYFL